MTSTTTQPAELPALSDEQIDALMPMPDCFPRQDLATGVAPAVYYSRAAVRAAVRAAMAASASQQAGQAPAEGDVVGAALRTGLEMAQELLAMKREALGDDYRLTRNYWEAEREITAAIAAHEAKPQPKHTALTVPGGPEWLLPGDVAARIAYEFPGTVTAPLVQSIAKAVHQLKATQAPAPVAVTFDLTEARAIVVDAIRRMRAGHVACADLEHSAEEFLRATNAAAKSDEMWDQTLRERDRYHEVADNLAQAIASHLGVEIGEHSSANCPWERALEALDEAPVPTVHAPQAPAVVAEERDLLRAAQAAAVMPLIGPLLDAWEQADREVMDEEPELVKWLKAINTAMETAGEEQT